jgi:hypothetical protein
MTSKYFVSDIATTKMNDNSATWLPVMSPTRGIDPRIALSSSIEAAPGVYAILVGSGMSTAAGIPTGWQVIQDLMRRVALSESAQLNELDESIEDWWMNQDYPEPRYDTLLNQLV